MMNKAVLLLAFFVSTLTANAEEPRFENFIDAELVVSDISMTEDGMVITYEGNVGKYGLVHTTHNMVSTNETSTRGYFTGTVQAINPSGDLEKSATMGLWSRDGTTLNVYGFDDADSSRILHIAEVDLMDKVNQVRVWELE